MAKQIAEWDQDQSHEQVTHIPDAKLPGELALRCEKLLQGDAGPQVCELVLMYERGELAPGDYTDAEIRSILDEAEE